MYVNVLVEGLPVVAADCGGKDCGIEWTVEGISVHSQYSIWDWTVSGW